MTYSMTSKVLTSLFRGLIMRRLATLLSVLIFNVGTSVALAQAPAQTLSPSLKQSIPANGESKGTGVTELEEVVSTFAKLCKFTVEYGKGISPKMGIKVDPTKLRCQNGLKEIADTNKLSLKQLSEGKYILEKQ